MKRFSKYNTLLWDFDGVLMDSMPVRDKGFELVLQHYPKDQVDQLMKYHRANGGLSRYVKFRYFFETIRNESLSDERLSELTTQFSMVMRAKLTDHTLLIEDSIDFVKSYHERFNMFIVSGSDGEELNYLCRELDIARYFQRIFGSPTPKKEIVHNIIKGNTQGNMVLIGDSVNDFDAARANSIDFFGYNNPELQQHSPNYIHSFKAFANE